MRTVTSEVGLMWYIGTILAFVITMCIAVLVLRGFLNLFCDQVHK